MSTTPEPKPGRFFMGKEQTRTLAEQEPLTIEKNVPVPPITHRERFSVIAEAARKMEIGDSIVTPYCRSPVAHNMFKATGFKFTQRKEGANLRIWRIE